MIAFILIALLGLIYTSKINDNTKFILIFTTLLLIAGLSFGFGTDYFSYEYIYTNKDVMTTAEFNRIEPGFKMLVYLFNNYNISYQLFVVVLKSISLVFTALWIKKNSNSPSQSLLLYFAMFFVVWTMSALRQGIVLPVVLYYCFSKDKSLSIVYKVILLFALSFLHTSILVMIPVVFLSEVRWKKRTLLYILIISLISTMLPLEMIANALSFIPLMNSLVIYIEPNFGFFDMAAIMRLFFFVIVYFYYDRLIEEGHDRRYINTFLLGTSIYFVLKFSEITAGRMNIYTFVMVLLYLPDIFMFVVDDFKLVKYRKILSFSFLTVCSLFFITKEMSTYQNQVGYQNSSSIYNIQTIFNKDYRKFDNYYAFLTIETLDYDQKFDAFVEEIQNFKTSKFNEDNNYMVVKDYETEKYGILNSDGDWFIEPKLKKKPKIYGNILVESQKQDLIYTDYYTDYSRNTKNQNSLSKMVAEHIANFEVNGFPKETSVEGDFFSIIQNPNDYIDFPENVGKSRVVKLELGDITYHVLYFKYYHYDYYIHLDENKIPFDDTIASSIGYYDSNDFMTLKTRNGTQTYNKHGKMVWMTLSE